MQIWALILKIALKIYIKKQRALKRACAQKFAQKSAKKSRLVPLHFLALFWARAHALFLMLKRARVCLKIALILDFSEQKGEMSMKIEWEQIKKKEPMAGLVVL